MYVLISIVFIAELIIAGAIIMSLYTIDKRVLALNDTITMQSPKIINGLKAARESCQKISDTVKKACETLQKPKERYLLILIKNLLTVIAIFMSKGKRKKILSAIQLGLSIRDFLTCKW